MYNRAMRKYITSVFAFLSGCSCGSPSEEGDEDGSSSSGIHLDSSSSSGEDDEESMSDSIRLDFQVDQDIPASDETSECVEVTLSVDPVIPTMVLLVDQSGSMTSGFGDGTRWEAVYNTLMDPVSGVVFTTQERIRFGLSLYTSNGGDAGGVCPMLTSVDPDISNYEAIETAFSTAAPVNDTPTGDSLDAVALALAAMSGNEPRAIVLATDGEPDTCEVPNPQLGQAESIAAAQSAWNLGLQTFVLSVGSEVSQTHLQEMANAGSGKDPLDMMDPTPYYQALNPDQLVAAFDEIINSFVSCTFTIDGQILGDPCEGTVLLDGEPIECTDGWNATDDSTIELLGETCESLKDGEPHTVEVVFPCDSVYIP